MIGVVRGVERLQALVYEARAPEDKTAPWRRVEVLELRPFDGLREAWAALAEVRAWDAATLAHVRTILRETVPGLDVPSALPALADDVVAKPKATAAHPRAFRGTKEQPPKARAMEPVDVRPYLIARRTTDEVLGMLGQPRVEAEAFEPWFVTHLLPLVRGPEAGVFAALAKAMELKANAALLAALVGVYLAAPANAAAWWSHVLAHDERIVVAQMVSASGAAARDPMEPALAEQIARLPHADQWLMYQGWANGAEAAYLASGIALDGLRDMPSYNEVPAGREDVTALVEQAVAQMELEETSAAYWRGYLWRFLGERPEFAEVLASSAYRTLAADAAYNVVDIAGRAVCGGYEEGRSWRELAPLFLGIVEETARTAPAYQQKLVWSVAQTLFWSDASREPYADVLALCLDACKNLARPPFGTAALVNDVVCSFAIRVEDPVARRAILAAPDRSWLALERACARDDRQQALMRGFGWLARGVPALLAATFPTHAGAAIEAADAIAILSHEAAMRLLTDEAKSALAATNSDAPIEELCRLVEPIARGGGPNPIRRALREHLAGTKVLSDAQLRGHRARIVASLPIVRLAAIRQAVDRAIAARVGLTAIDTPTMRHALAMLQHADIHRRTLRRMLAALLAGDPGWRLAHQRTRAWFARHPAIDREAWLAGIELRRDVENLGEIKLAFEDDPLETLKLGTYVGSCLGRGGLMEFSAAAVALDANKHVVYAKDARGQVIGRQLLALSEAEELVCFRVYGADAEKLEPLFVELDRAFAERLRVPLCTNREYEIVSILSRDWYDDGAMSFE